MLTPDRIKVLRLLVADHVIHPPPGGRIADIETLSAIADDLRSMYAECVRRPGEVQELRQ